MISLIIIIPLILACIILFSKNKKLTRFILILVPLIFLGVSSAALLNYSWIILPKSLSIYFAFDSLGNYFLGIMSVVYLAVSVYSISYFNNHDLSVNDENKYSATIIIFVVAMAGVLLTTHLALLWVFVEATTLSSALLIYFQKSKSSLEATWKYVYICSIGISLAFVGIIILSIGAKSFDSLFFSDLYEHAKEINPFWLQIAFAFIFVGFGTKVGVAPIHAWLPDAHSEAPSPVSALLSAALLNSAFLGLIRVQKIMINAGIDGFSNSLFLITGFFSLFISAVFMLKVKNYKRMLAYSSIENMGILFIGLALGTPGIIAAMIHTIAHSFSKTSLFLTSGNILHLYKSKNTGNIEGIIKKEPKTGWLWLISMLSISGMPPFPSFISEFLILQAFFITGNGWLAIPFALFLTVIMFGMGSTVFKMSFGNSNNEAEVSISFSSIFPQIIILTILFIIGTNMPDGISSIINNAANFLK